MTYEQTKLHALTTQTRQEYRGLNCLWTCIFVPLGDDKVKEVGLSDGGEIREGFTFQLNGNKIDIV